MFVILDEDTFELSDEFKNEPTKVCSKCGRELPLSAFTNASGGNYKRGECKDCERALNNVRTKIKSTAPPVPKDHTCPICGRNEEQVKDRGGKKSGTWCCDHDHETDEFRGWICHDCNRGIGNLGDSVERLQKAIDYISKSKT